MRRATRLVPCTKCRFREISRYLHHDWLCQSRILCTTHEGGGSTLAAGLSPRIYWSKHRGWFLRCACWRYNNC